MSAPEGMTPSEHQFALQAAYRIAQSAKLQTRDQLFFALDRFDHDQAETDDGQSQRREAKALLCAELDRRSIPVRDPLGQKNYPPARLSLG